SPTRPTRGCVIARWKSWWVWRKGMSGISCAVGRFNVSGRRSREPFAEENGELGFGHTPLARRHDPLLLGTVQDQEEQLGCGLVTGEVSSGPDRPSELGIQRLDGVRGVQNPPDIAGESIERGDLAPG